MTWYLKYNQQFLANPGQNDAAKYGVTIEPASAQPDQTYYRCIGIHHLTGAENSGNHHLYLDVLDEAGKRINGARLMISNAGKAPYPVIIDKPLNEAGANAPMHWNDTLLVYVGGDFPTEKAAGFHIRHEDEEPGATRGHHSFYAVFQRTKQQPPPPEPEPPDPGPDPQPPTDWHLHFNVGELWLIEECRKKPGGPLEALVAKMAGVLDVISGNS